MVSSARHVLINTLLKSQFWRCGRDYAKNYQLNMDVKIIIIATHIHHFIQNYYDAFVDT